MSLPRYAEQASRALALRKRVLFVEGPDDEPVYTQWLAKIDRLFAARLEVLQVASQQKLTKALSLLGNPQDVFALIDRDEWDDTKVAAVKALYPRLIVNSSRHCLESYFCDPDEISLSLTTRDAATFGPLLPGIRAVLVAALPEWVDHWSLWTALMRVQNRMVEERVPYFFNDAVPLPDDAIVRERMELWSEIVDADAMFNNFTTLREWARLQPRSLQYRSCVYGKDFFTSIVLPQLQQLQAGDARTWMVNLAEWGPGIPEDLRLLLVQLLVLKLPT